MKNKTIAAWTALLGGPLGLHRFYLYGWSDRLGWAIQLPTLIGLYGVQRARQLGLDDQLSWVLIPFLGFTIAGCALCSIVFGLTSAEKWNHRHNPTLASDSAAGATHWFTVGALIAALLIGTTVLMASLAFTFQRYFEYQVQADPLQTQSATPKKPAD